MLKKLRIKLVWIVRCLLGFGSIDDGSICWFTKRFGIEAHDYPKHKGGTGTAWHFMMYQCPRCKRTFFI